MSLCRGIRPEVFLISYGMKSKDQPTSPAASKNPGENSNPFLTPQQLAERWQCSLMKLRRMRRAGQLPVLYIGRSARYRLADVERIEAEACVG